MNRHFALLIGFLWCLGASAQYDIAVKLNGLSCSDELILAKHFGDNKYITDTSKCENGLFHFKGEETLSNGVYLVVLPKKSYFEILVSAAEDQTKYYFEADTSLNSQKTLTKGSMENELFIEFNKLAMTEGRKASELTKAYKAESDEKAKKKLKEKINSISDVVFTKRSEIVSKYPNLFIGKLYNAMTDMDVPEAPENLDEKEAQKFKYLWMRDHYWDNVDLSEDGLVQSPVFHNKLKDYFDVYMPPVPDTAILMADRLLNSMEAAGGSDQFKYSVQYLLGYFEKSKFMCFDKPLWHMAKNYYCAGRAYWADSAYTAKMCEESAKMEPTLCDELAPDLSMPDSSFGQRITMSQINKPVTVLVFWDINCGHCKKEMPIISSMYDSMTNEHFEIYAVYTQGDWEGWKKRLAKEKYNFINVANAYGEDKFRDKYNIRSTPQIYILDKDKNIRFKKIGAADIAGTIQYLLEEQGIVEPKEPKE